MINADRPPLYFVKVVNRQKLENALRNLEDFDIWDCVDFINCPTLALARTTALRHQPPGEIWERTDIRPNGDYASERIA